MLEKISVFSLPEFLRREGKMKEIILASKRRWNWKVFLVLVGLIIPAVFAILPYTIDLQNTSNGTDLVAAYGWGTLVLDRLINILPIILLGGLGLILANQIGLGLPFVEGWIRGTPVPVRFRNVVAIALIVAIILVMTSLLLHNLVLDPPLNALLAKLGIPLPAGAQTPPLYGFLAAFSAGITEETLYRLFGLSLIAWLGGLLFHDSDGRPNQTVFWVANILFAVGFGLAHLPKAATMGLPINTFVVTYTLALNGIGGLLFGWMFWTFGLESAMLAHFFADVIMYALLPWIGLQNSGTAKYLVTAGVIVLVLLALVWAWRTLISKDQSYAASSELKGS
jgi:Type II CAAX prenyl endopeptidase Rce1-like